MKSEINVIGNIQSFNTSIIGTSQSGKTDLGKQLQKDGYYYLAIDRLNVVDVKIDEIILFLGYEKELQLNYNQSMILSNVIFLVNNGYKKIIMDDLLTSLDLSIRRKLMEKLKEKDIRFINITMDIEDVLFTDYIIVMFNNQVALEGKTLEVLKEEKILKRMGLTLPFIVDLSIQLKYYGLIDKIYLDRDELVDVLWK